MGFSLSNESWSLKSEPLSGHGDEPTGDNSPNEPFPPTPLDLKVIGDLHAKIRGMDIKFENLQDLIMSCHFKFEVIIETLNKVKDITKETRTDMGKICLHLIQTIKEAIKVAQRIQNSSMLWQPI